MALETKTDSKLEVSKASPLETSAGAYPVLLCEFRGQAADVIKWTDKQTGKAREMQKINVAAELRETGRQITLEVLPERGVETVTALPFKRGDIVLVSLSAYSNTREKGQSARVASMSLYSTP